MNLDNNVTLKADPESAGISTSPSSDAIAPPPPPPSGLGNTVEGIRSEPFPSTALNPHNPSESKERDLREQDSQEREFCYAFVSNLPECTSVNARQVKADFLAWFNATLPPLLTEQEKKERAALERKISEGSDTKAKCEPQDGAENVDAPVVVVTGKPPARMARLDEIGVKIVDFQIDAGVALVALTCAHDLWLSLKLTGREYQSQMISVCPLLSLPDQQYQKLPLMLKAPPPSTSPYIKSWTGKYICFAEIPTSTQPTELSQLFEALGGPMSSFACHFVEGRFMGCGRLSLVNELITASFVQRLNDAPMGEKRVRIAAMMPHRRKNAYRYAALAPNTDADLKLFQLFRIAAAKQNLNNNFRHFPTYPIQREHRKKDLAQNDPKLMSTGQQFTTQICSDEQSTAPSAGPPILCTSITDQILRNDALNALIFQTSTFYAATPSRVVVLQNALRMEDIVCSELSDQIKESMQREASKYGAIEDVRLPRPPLPNPVMARIFIAYTDITSARQAQYEFNGRKFDGRTLSAFFYPLLAYQLEQYYFTLM